MQMKPWHKTHETKVKGLGLKQQQLVSVYLRGNCGVSKMDGECYESTVEAQFANGFFYEQFGLQIKF